MSDRDTRLCDELRKTGVTADELRDARAAYERHPVNQYEGDTYTLRCVEALDTIAEWLREEENYKRPLTDREESLLLLFAKGDDKQRETLLPCLKYRARQIAEAIMDPEEESFREEADLFLRLKEAPRVVVKTFGKRYEGELLYLYTYQKLLEDKQGRPFWEERNQRAGVLCDAGRELHFTVHFTLEYVKEG